MATNRNAGTDAIIIRGRPDLHEQTLNRQGQFVRLLHARKCACIKNGKADLFCSLCKGKGYRTFFQSDIQVLEENSPHYDDGYVYPYWVPVSSVEKVQKFLAPAYGGNVFYDVEAISSNSIKLVDNGKLAHYFEPLKVTYKYQNSEQVTNENSMHLGLDYLLYTLASEIDTTKETSNPLQIYGDIISVSRIYNKTQDLTYTLDYFNKSLIAIQSDLGNVLSIQYTGTGTACNLTINPVGSLATTVMGGPGGENLNITLSGYMTIGDLVNYINTISSYSATLLGATGILTTKLNAITSGDNLDIKTVKNLKATETPPLITDVLEVDYIYVKPVLAMVARVKLDNPLEKMAEDIKIGDVMLTLLGSMFVSRGDLFSVMSTILKGQALIIRGRADFDELPAFDVTEIVDKIEDEDGNVYTPTQFELREYNNLVWTTNTKPAAGKKYGVNYLYRPTYMIYRAETQNVNVGNRRYPFRAYARLCNKLTLKDLEINP